LTYGCSRSYKVIEICTCIQEFAKLKGISLGEAMDLFYHSTTFQLLQEGIADLHCRSDLYLADELMMEYP